MTGQTLSPTVCDMKTATLTKRDIAALQRAVDILNEKAPGNSPLYETLVNEGCQPSTACGTLNDIIATVEKMKP